jgi:hypothetical protein
VVNLLSLLFPPAPISDGICRNHPIPPDASRRDPELTGSTTIAITIARTVEVNVIKKVTGGYKVLSEKGKNLGGPYKSKAAAQKRLCQVEYFKHKG